MQEFEYIGVSVRRTNERWITNVYRSPKKIYNYASRFSNVPRTSLRSLFMGQCIRAISICSSEQLFMDFKRLFCASLLKRGWTGYDLRTVGRHPRYDQRQEYARVYHERKQRKKEWLRRQSQYNVLLSDGHYADAELCVESKSYIIFTYQKSLRSQLDTFKRTVLEITSALPFDIDFEFGYRHTKRLAHFAI